MLDSRDDNIYSSYVWECFLCIQCNPTSKYLCLILSGSVLSCFSAHCLTLSITVLSHTSALVSPLFDPVVVSLWGSGFLEVFLIDDGGDGSEGGAFGAVVSVFFLVKDEVFFTDSAGVMGFSGFFSSTTWSSLDLNEPKHDADKV